MGIRNTSVHGSLIRALLFIGLLTSCTSLPISNSTSTAIPTLTETFVPSRTSAITPYPIVNSPSPAPSSANSDSEVFFLSIADSGFFHLFVYSPSSLPVTRITNGNWDDISPALEITGKRLAFSSHRNGYWDLYIMDLASGQTTPFTDTPEYDSAPSWSPDGAFIAYESYQNENLEIFIKSTLDPLNDAIQLTSDPALDTSPAWSPRGRQIAFISNRSGNEDVWVADLDQAGSLKNISNSNNVNESNPSWSPDGRYLTWSSNDLVTGQDNIYIWNSELQAISSTPLAAGSESAWMNNGEIAVINNYPDQFQLIGFSLSGIIDLPPITYLHEIKGFSYGRVPTDLSGIILPPGEENSILSLSQESFSTRQLSEKVTLVENNDEIGGRIKLVEPAFKSFTTLRHQVKELIGWDALEKLESTYIPLSSSLNPGMEKDWLLTGRAIALDPALIQSDWMIVIRENFDQGIYWRIYLKTNAQDGSQGEPITQAPWDFSTRTKDSISFENGGSFMSSAPKGYWFDLTSLAAQYGWRRLPALSIWRTYYEGANFNLLVYSEDLDWYSAMLQLYPPEILLTPTRVIPPSRTPTRTPLWYRTPTPSFNPTINPTSTH